jgi:glutamyl/glutaminyl-tRNA synthetase
MEPMTTGYRGRLAPSPTGYLHLGHARTFWWASERARMANGTLVLRDDDLDASRARPAFAQAQMDDLRWFGLSWSEGPDVGGPFGPYRQSLRSSFYAAAFARLRDTGFLYPCHCTRRDIQAAVSAPHANDDEPIYPGTCRPRLIPSPVRPSSPAHWRFRVPDGEDCTFIDGAVGPVALVAGRDFGDFVVWRNDGVPSYQLACIVDDTAMGITEVVRGVDLLISTARQRLLAHALGWTPPSYYHCPLWCDSNGVRLAKRSDALSLRSLREAGWTPEQLRARPEFAPIFPSAGA